MGMSCLQIITNNVHIPSQQGPRGPEGRSTAADAASKDAKHGQESNQLCQGGRDFKSQEEGATLPVAWWMDYEC